MLWKEAKGGMEAEEWRATQRTLWGFRAVMDMAVVIIQRLLLPTLPHLRLPKCRYIAEGLLSI